MKDTKGFSGRTQCSADAAVHAQTVDPFVGLRYYNSPLARLSTRNFARPHQRPVWSVAFHGGRRTL